MKKTIIFTLVETDLQLPKHLQKPPQVDLQINGFTNLQAILLLSSTLTNLLSNLQEQAEQQVKEFNNNLKKIN